MKTSISTPLEELTTLMMRVHRILRQRNATAMRGMGVSMLQLHGLLTIREKPGITMKELAMHLAVTSPTATVFVARLEQQGLLERIHDTKNRKIVRVSLTSQGRSLAERAYRHFEKAFQAVFGKLPKDELEKLIHIFNHLLRLHSDTSHA